MLLNSRLPIQDKATLVNLYKEAETKDKELSLLKDSKEKELMAKDDKIAMLQDSKEKELLAKDLEIIMLKVIKVQEIENLKKEKERESVYKMHYQNKLCVRFLIENFETRFGEKLTKANMSRVDKWSMYLNLEGKFKPFKDLGLSVADVANHVDNIFKSQSANIHTLEAVENLVLKVKASMQENEVKIVKVLIANSEFRELVEIQ